MPLSIANRLKLISKAWGQQSGYAFFPWIDGTAEDKGQRIRGYNEGPAFLWPTDKDKIIAHMEAHTDDDLYFCPMLFEKKQRKIEFAMDEHALWADLDEVDPREIDEQYTPTIAWETSPGRYQALWIITGGDIQGASWGGNENQRLTYYLGADHSGWDTTQLLRVPEWENHKPDYRRKDGTPAPGQLLWHNGRRYLPDDFSDLPEVRGASDSTELAADVLESTIAAVDRLDVWGRTRLKCTKEVRELVSARSTGGQDRSDKLWQIERDLADAGLTVPEIVAIVRETVWNKFSGRNDELKRLVSEAAKAVAEVSAEQGAIIEKDREEKPKPRNIMDVIAEAELPVWLVKNIITQASCGFFAGEPKSFKSWCALDLAFSIATGAPFLNAFDVLEPGPVLYLQEEDPVPTLKDRIGKIAPSKTQDRVTLGELDDNGIASLVWEPADENDVKPKINTLVQEQFTVSDPGWQAWLDETLSEGYKAGDEEGEEGEPYKLLLLDPLMMIAGDVDENRAQEMTEKIYKPLKQICKKHQVSILIVHHMRKGRDGDSGQRGGQKMLGSVANHAWSENSLYFTHGTRGTMLVETESKHAPATRFVITNLKKKNAAGGLTWAPEVNTVSDEDDATDRAKTPGKARAARRQASGNTRLGQGSRKKLARHLGLEDDATQAEIRDAWEADGRVWGEWDDILAAPTPRKNQGTGGTPGRKAETNPIALKALKKLTARKARAYSTHEIKDEMALMMNTKPTQTIYLRAYQQLKKLYDLDQITRVEKDWLLPDVTQDDLYENEIEELI